MAKMAPGCTLVRGINDYHFQIRRLTDCGSALSGGNPGSKLISLSLFAMASLVDYTYDLFYLMLHVK